MAESTPETLRRAEEIALAIIHASGGDPKRAKEAAVIIASAIAEALPQWRPIEMAPKDGTHIFVTVISMASGRTTRIAHFNGIYGWQVVPGQWSLQPTHWMPLPEQPHE
jgi:hypothetical protein